MVPKEFTTMELLKPSIMDKLRTMELLKTQMAEQFCAIVDESLNSVPKQVQLQLPKLKK